MSNKDTKDLSVSASQLLEKISNSFYDREPKVSLVFSSAEVQVVKSHLEELLLELLIELGSLNIQTD